MLREMQAAAGLIEAGVGAFYYFARSVRPQRVHSAFSEPLGERFGIVTGLGDSFRCHQLCIDSTHGWPAHALFVRLGWALPSRQASIRKKRLGARRL